MGDRWSTEVEEEEEEEEKKEEEEEEKKEEDLLLFFSFGTRLRRCFHLFSRKSDRRERRVGRSCC